MNIQDKAFPFEETCGNRPLYFINSSAKKHFTLKVLQNSNSVFQIATILCVHNIEQQLGHQWIQKVIDILYRCIP